MDYKVVAKLMAVFFFISSGFSAFCLYNLAEFYVTGKLPFGLEPIVPQTPEGDEEKTEAEKVEEETEAKLKKESEEKQKAPGIGYMNRINERMVRELYNRLRDMEEKISEEREKVAAEKKSAEEIQGQAIKMQAELEKYREKIKELLDFVDKKEIKNLQKITRLIESLELEQAVTMFLTYDKNKAARLLYYMNPKVAKEVVANILETAKDDLAKEDIRDITERMHRLTEELGDE